MRIKLSVVQQDINQCKEREFQYLVNQMVHGIQDAHAQH